MNITPVFPIGEPNPYGKFFTGKTYLTFLNVYDETFKTSLGNVKRLNSSRFFLSDTGRGIFDIFDIRVFTTALRATMQPSGIKVFFKIVAFLATQT